jgi:hypothetical protein
MEGESMEGESMEYLKNLWARRRPWWCDCNSGEDYDGEHYPECYGNSQAFPRLTAALADGNRRNRPEGR